MFVHARKTECTRRMRDTIVVDEDLTLTTTELRLTKITQPNHASIMAIVSHTKVHPFFSPMNFTLSVSIEMS